MFKKIKLIHAIFLLSASASFSKAMENKTKILKLGGSLITDKSAQEGTPKQNVIDRIAEEISSYKGKLILVNGAGSYGHPLAKKYKLTTEFNREGAIITHNSVVELNKLLVDTLQKNGIPAIPVPPMGAFLCKNKKILEGPINTIKLMLEKGFVPVLFGDVAMDADKGVCILSGDRIIPYLSEKLNISEIGFAGATDGVYDDEGKIIPKINKDNFDSVKKRIGKSEHTDVTGGMLGQVQEILSMKNKIAYIFNGNKKGNIKDFLSGKKTGTRIVS